MTKKAVQIAYEAHKGQIGKDGIPYVFHPFHLAELMDSEEAVIVALLHDVVEDNDAWTFDRLKKQGFSTTVMDALKLLTHSRDTDYLNYIQQIKKSLNPLAIKVKFADLSHNSDLSRLSYADQKDMERIHQYTEAIEILKE